MCSLRIFTSSEVEKFKDDLQRLKVKQKIAKRAITFATKYIFYSEHFPAFIHCSSFNKHIGNVNGDPFPMWLKRNLFVEVDSTYIPGEKCKGWMINKEFYVEIRQLLETVEMEKTIEETAQKLGSKDLVKIYAEELNGEKPFEYSEGTDGRFYHPLQGVRRELKNDILFTDFVDYDISSAAPTILFQLYRRLYDRVGIDYNRINILPYIDHYISNKEQVRREFAEKYQIDEEIAKKILNSLFNKARLAANGYCIIFSKYLEFDYDRMKQMQNDPVILGLRRDISWMWKKIESGFNSEYDLRKGKKTKRWYYYFAEERKILDVIIEELNKLTGKALCGYYLEHDGVRIHKKYNLDIRELERTIQRKTGYFLTFINK